MGFLDFLRGPDEEEELVGAQLPAAPAEPPAATQGTIENPMVREYMMKRRQLQDQIKQDSSGPNFKAGLAALGAGLSGGNAAAAGSAVLDRQKAMGDKRLTDFDSEHDLTAKLGTEAREQDLIAKESDPNSEESRLAQQLGIKMGMNPQMAGKMTAAQFKKSGPYQQKLFEIEQRGLDRKDSKEERRMLYGLKHDDMQLQRDLKQDEKMQGLQTPYGLANTVDDAKQLKEAHESKKNFDSKISEMIALRKKHGGGALLNRDDVARGKQLSKDLLLEYKNMAKLGVLSKSDESIINTIIPDDPLAYDLVPGQDPILTKLEAFQKDNDRDFTTRIATRTREGLKNTQAGATPETKKTRDGKQYKKVPGGWELIKDEAVGASGAGRGRDG